MKNVTFLFAAILILCVIALWYATVMYQQGIRRDCDKIVVLDQRLDALEGKNPGVYKTKYEYCLKHYPL